MAGKVRRPALTLIPKLQVSCLGRPIHPTDNILVVKYDKAARGFS